MPAASPPRWRRAKMERAGQDTSAVRQEAPWPHVVHAGPFTVGFLPIAHSIPESSALVIDTPAGRILHSGDFKADPTPLVGEPFDAEAFRALGDAGVKVLACDSTNVFNLHAGRSEATLIEPIGRLMQEAEGMVVGDHLRLERGAAEDAGAGGAGGGARGGDPRAGDEHHAPDGARRRGAGGVSARRSIRSTPRTCRGGTCSCSPPAARASGAPPRRSWRRGSSSASSSGRGTPSSSRRRPSPATRWRSRASSTS